MVGAVQENKSFHLGEELLGRLVRCGVNYTTREWSACATCQISKRSSLGNFIKAWNVRTMLFVVGVLNAMIERTALVDKKVFLGASSA